MARRRTRTQAPPASAPVVSTEPEAPPIIAPHDAPAPEAPVDATTASGQTPEEKMTVLKQGVVDAKAAAKVAKKAVTDAEKAHKVAKDAIDTEDNDTLLASAQAEQVVETTKKGAIEAARKIKVAQNKVEKETEKQKAVKALRANDEGFLTAIKADAKEIKTRLDKASKLESDADDHRLAAAIKMGTVHLSVREQTREQGNQQGHDLQGMVRTAFHRRP